MKNLKEQMAILEVDSREEYIEKLGRQLIKKLQGSLDILNDTTMFPCVHIKARVFKLASHIDTVKAYPYDPGCFSFEDIYSDRHLELTPLERTISIDPAFRHFLAGENVKAFYERNTLAEEVFITHVMEQLAVMTARGVNDEAYLAKRGDRDSVSTSFDGFGTHIAAAIEAERIVVGTGLVPIKTGPITESNAVSKLEMMVSSMSTAFRKFNLYCSWDVFEKYNTDNYERYKYVMRAKENSAYYMPGTARNINIVPCTWMGTSQRLIATPKENLLTGVDGLVGMDKLYTKITYVEKSQ